MALTLNDLPDFHRSDQIAILIFNKLSCKRVLPYLFVWHYGSIRAVLIGRRWLDVGEKSLPYDGLDSIRADKKIKRIGLVLIRGHRNLAVGSLLELDDSTVDDQVHSLLSGNCDEAGVQMMTVDEPPRIPKCVFHLLDEGVSNFGAVLSPEVEIVEPNEIFADGLVDSILDEKSRHIWCLD